MNIRIIITALIIALFSFTASATFQEASKLYEEKKYGEAFAEYHQLAKIGHKSSQFNVGVMYLEGVGVKQDLIKAYAWVKLSDEGKNKEKVLLEEIKGYFSELSMIQVAESSYNSLYSKYSPEAIIEAYYPIITNNIQKKDTPTPIERENPEYPIKAQLKGYTGWVTFSFHLSPNGYPVDIRVIDSFPGDLFVKNSLAAVKRWRFQPDVSTLKKAYEYRLEFALKSSGKRGSGGVSAYKELKKLEKKAIDGDPVSQYLHARYGWYNHDGRGKFNSTSWFYEAARNGVANAQYNVAERLLSGNGCKAEPDKAINWLTLSASGDFAASQFKLATLAFNKGDSVKGLEWLNKALASNIENPAFDSYVLAYDILHYIYQNQIEGIDPQMVIAQLEKVDEDSVTNPVNYFQYYSYAYKDMRNFDKALDYQEEAIETLEDLGEENIPQEMLDNLAYLETKAR